MAVTAEQYQTTINNATAGFSEVVLANIAKEKSGCLVDWSQQFCWLKQIESGEFFYSLGDYASSDDSETIYRLLNQIRGSAEALVVSPSVNAGPDTSIRLPVSSKQFTGTVTQGTYPIASTVWTQVSGPNTATLTNATTLTMTASGLIEGSYVFKLTATDNRGNTGNDNVSLTVNAAYPIAYYGSKNDGAVLSQSQIEAGSTTTFVSGGSVLIPYDNITVQYMWFAIPSSQPVKDYYEDTASPLNQGPIGSPSDFYGAPTTVGPYDFYISNYPSSYPDYTPNRGIIFKTL